MIKVNLLKSYFDAMAPRVLATKTILVRNETELAQKIKDFANGELFLVVVIPSSDTTARNSDNILEKETIILYAIKKVSHKDQDDADVISDMIQTQECITAVKDALLEDAGDCDALMHEQLSRLDFNSMHTDPEYNYLGCDGYSLSFVITSPGF